MTQISSLYDAILKQLNHDCEISSIQIGNSWVVTTLKDGRCGISARMFDIALERPEIMVERFQSAHRLSRLIMDDDLYYSSLACSAINACQNSFKEIKYSNKLISHNVLCTEGLDLNGKTLCVIGHMKRTFEEINSRYALKNSYMFDLDPSKGDLPPSMEPEILPQCDVVIITATTLINHTIDDIIRWSPRAFRILYGPSSPYIKNIPGIHRIQGMCVRVASEFIQWNKTGKGSPLSLCESFMIGR